MEDKPSTGSEGILVGIRMRPMNDRELAAGQEKIYRCMNAHNAVAQQTKEGGQAVEGQTYFYDKVFDETTSTSNVYDAIGKDIVRGVVSGINGTIFAYGQTSSGKTHTMLGNQKDQRGVLEMSAEDIFSHICATSGRDFLLRVSFVEIYNEIIRDLLSDAADATVSIREDPKRGVYCEAQEHVIADYESIIRALKKGIAKRAVEATAMNDTSSRSHTIFKLVIESKENGSGGDADPDGAVLVSTLNLVDLAGSESVRHTGATGQRAKEGGKINQSLLSLSRVIHALSQPGAHVSFRDSKLTRLLQPSLCGNAKMSVVCCITPAEKYLEETRSTLQFASRAKLVKTHAVVNEVLDEAAALRRLRKELDELKEKQGAKGVSEEEQQRMEAEKADLLGRLEALQQERNEQREQLDRLKELLVTSSASSNSVAASLDDRKRRKRHRDTWCPGSAALQLGGGPLAFPEGGSFVQGRVSSAFGMPAFNPLMDEAEEGEEETSNTSSSRSDVSSASLALQALSAQLAARDDQVAALQRQVDRLQARGSKVCDGAENAEDDEDDEEGDTVPLDEVGHQDTADQLVEALSQLQARDEQVRSLDAQMQALTAQHSLLLQAQAGAAAQDEQTECILRGMEEEQTRLMETVEQQALALAESQASLAEARENIAQLSQQLLEAAVQPTLAPVSAPDDNNAAEELAVQLAALREELQHAEELIAEMEADMQGWRTDAELLRATVDESHGREESLAQAVQDADAEVATLRLQIQTLEGQLEGSVGDLHEARAQAAEAALALQTAQAESARLAEEQGEAAGQAAGQAVEAAKEEARAEALRLTESAVTAEESLARAMDELAAAQGALTAAGEGMAARASEAACAVSALQSAQQQLEAARVEQAAEQAACAALLASSEQREAALKENVESLSAKLFKATAAVAAATAAAAVPAPPPTPTHGSTVMHMHRNDTDHAGLTVDSIEAARREMERTVEAMRRELGTQEGEVSRLMALAAEWQDRAQRAEHVASSSLAAEQSAAGGDEAQRKRIGQLQTQADLLRGERDSALKRASEAEAELRSLSGRAAVAEEALQQQLKTQATRLEKLQADSGATQRLSEAVKALEARLAEARVERDEAKGFAEAAAARVSVLEEQCASLQQQAASAGPGATEALAALKADLGSATERGALALQRCEGLERDGAEAQSRLRKAKEEGAMLRGEWDRACEQARVLQQQKAALSTQLDEALQQVQALTGALTEAEDLTLSGGNAASALDQEQIAELRAQCEALQAELADTLQRAQDAEDTVAAAETAAAEATRAAGEARRAMQSELEATEDEVAALQKGQAMQQTRLVAAEAGVRAAEEALAKATSATAAAQQERAALARQVDTLSRQAAEGASAATAASIAISELSQLQTRLSDALAALQDLRDEASSKDKRIAHLESSKLTQEQLEKIKAVKEERKRLSEDNKVMKRQLQQLKKAYDDLKVAAADAAGSAGASGAALAEASDLRVQLQAVQGVSHSLKEKLRECSAQLQDYEIERSGVLAVLQANGVDVSDLAAQDLSLSEDLQGAQRDLQDAVRQLAERGQGQASATQAALQRELAALGAAKADLERRCDDMRQREEAAKEEFDAIVADGEDLRAKIVELSEALEGAERRASSSADGASSEMQALEEENIALMRDNRELRREVSALKASVERLQGQAAKLGSAVGSVAAASVPAAALEAPKSHGKENRGPSQHNVEVGQAEPSSERKRPMSAVKPSPAVSGAAPEEAASGAKRVHKKAKPVVAAPERGPTEDGECAQS